MKPLLLILCLIPATIFAEEKPTVTTPDLSLTDLDGQIRDLGQNPTSRPRAIVFTGTECPISNALIPALNRITEEFADRVDIFGVVSDRTVSRSEAKTHFEEFEAQFPILFDASATLAESLKPTHVPEAFVFDSKGRLIFRGAINNAFIDLTRRRANVEAHYLRDAIASAVVGDPFAEAYVKPVGCIFESHQETQSDIAEITYARDIAPVLNARCVSCHREGQAAPFALTNYESAAKRARQLLRVAHSGIMPPWMPKPGAQPRFLGERWLRPQEQQLLERWVGGGKAEGDPADLPALPEFPSGWELGEPDLVLKMTESFEVYADGPDILQNFVIPVDIPEDKLVRAIQFRPGNERVVHHSVLFLDDKGAARKLDAATPEPGYSNFGSAGFLPSGALGGWSVGNTARELPDGMGRHLKKGSDLVMQIHYHPTGKVEIDQSEVGVYFIDRPVEEVLKEPAKLVSSFWISDYEIEIPAGDANYESTASYTLPRDVLMVGIVPHMHLLGKSVRVTATLPDKTSQTLIDVPSWNYNWQDEFYYERPFPLPAGTKIDVAAVFDNSDGNPSNPSHPPKAVRWGDGTLDEMMFCFFLFSSEKVEDIIRVALHNLGHDMKQPRLESQNQ
ncbi:MAG: redoxin domain-containing protein [Verrucomicrobiota bacterium]